MLVLQVMYSNTYVIFMCMVYNFLTIFSIKLLTISVMKYLSC